MTDLSSNHTYTGKYSGLLNNLWVTLAVAGVCLVGYELEVHVPRRRGKDGTFQRIPTRIARTARREWSKWRRKGRKAENKEERPSQEGLVREKTRGDGPPDGEVDAARAKLGPRESWEFGYIYQPKAWRLVPGPPLPKWPLAWIWSTLKVRERDMPETCGLDITLHMRYLRGVFFYILLQACVVLPILMPLHIFYAPADVPETSMTRASISSLVADTGQKWLWVHAVLIWWVTITWTLTILWVTWGALAYRRREIKRLAERVKESREARRRLGLGEEGVNPETDRWTVGDDREGIKRFRTLMVTNVPPDMRDEQVLQDYFDHYIHRHKVRSGQITPKRAAPAADDSKHDTMLQRVVLSPKRLLRKPALPKAEPPVPTTPVGETAEPLGFRHSEDQCSEADSFESEVDDVILVRKLGQVAGIRARRTAVLRQLEVAHVKLAQRVLKAVAKHKTRSTETAKARVVIHPAHDIGDGIDGLNAVRNEPLPGDITKVERLDRLVQALGGFVDDEPDQLGKGTETVWDVLHSLPRELLDPYQSLTHLISTFREENAPLIDYLTTKLQYLTLLLDEARSKPLSSYAASSTAFVTFRDAKTARLASKILDSHPKRSLACHTSPAPDWTNLLWPRLAKSVYKSEFVRGWVVYLGVWAFTLVWIFPVSLLCALSSLTKIAGFIKPLENFVQKYPNAASAITTLVPVILVAGLTIAVCPILLVIANKAETINTRLAIHNSVLERYWKFLMVNGVVFFAIGQSAIQAYLTAFQDNTFDPLPTIATAFPTAAPYFASYVLLQTAIQPFFELFRFGLPTIVYVFGTRVSVIPRQRNGRTEYPTFSHFSQVPQHLLALAIMHLFMLLNPLVIPFCLVFYGSCYLVWKKQFTYVYGRLYENNGRRTSIRTLRYSLDALALAQFVLFAFFVLNKAKGAAISTGILCFFTIVEKLIITRALKRRFENFDIEEANILCPPVIREDDSPGAELGDASEEGSDEPGPKHSRETSGISSRFATLKHDVTSWAGQWGYAASHRSTPVGYKRPIPFDHVLFSTLDSKISFEQDDTSGRPRSSTVVSSVGDNELIHEPDHAIQHELAARLVMPHHGLRPWEDIPPYQRSRGYDDQPDYTDDYDDFLWLPRDPLSTLDLDDTVEMRLSLTTSAGGSGRIGDWPPLNETEIDHGQTIDETWHAVQAQNLDRIISPDAGSDQHLIDTPISPHIGSEVTDAFDSGVVRRRTKRVGEGLSNMFRRPRSGTNKTNRSDAAISMRTLSISSTPSAIAPAQAVGPATDLPDPQTTPTPAQRPSIQLVSQSERASMHRIPTPIIPPLRSNSATTRLETARPTTSDTFLSPTRVTTPQQIATGSASDGIEELALTPRRAERVEGSQDSKHVTVLGRDPEGRRPARLRSDSRLSATEPKTPTRSASILHPTRSRSIAMDRGRSASIWSREPPAAQKWLSEVMEEERLASKECKREEMQEEAKDHEALAVEAKNLARSGSKLETGLRSSGSRFGRVERSNSKRRAGEIVDGRPMVQRGVSGESAGSGRSGRSRFSGMGQLPKTAPL